MSDFSQSDCDNHEQSTPHARPLSSTSSNLENGTQPRPPRLPARQVLSEHDASEASFDSSSTSEEPGSFGDGDLGADDWSSDSGHFIDVSDLVVPHNILWRKEIRAARMAKEAKFLTSVPPTTVATPPTSWLAKCVSLLHSIKVDVKANATLMRPGLTYRDSYDVPAPEHPGPSITSICLTVPLGCPPKARRILTDPKEKGKWERCYDGYYKN